MSFGSDMLLTCEVGEVTGLDVSVGGILAPIIPSWLLTTVGPGTSDGNEGLKFHFDIYTPEN